MACNTCKKPEKYCGCKTPPPATGAVCQTDASAVIYHLKPGQVSKLSCVQIPNGANLEQILEKIDQAICRNGVPSPAGLNLGCLVDASHPRPVAFSGVVELLAATICQLRQDTAISQIISQLLANTGFINNLATLIALNPGFVQTLLQNNSFLTGLAGNSTFTTALAQNQNFVNQLGNSLVNTPQFLTNLANALTGDPTLAEKFCCDNQSGCTSFFVNGVQQTTCDCQPPTNLVLTGPATVAPNTDTVYTLGYAGTPGTLSFTVSGGTLMSQSGASATVRFTAAGTLTASLVGCDGLTQTSSRNVSLTATCVAVTGLAVTGPAQIQTNTTQTYTRTVSGGAILTQTWAVTGNGTIQGSNTGTSVSVAWTSSGGTVSLTATDCSGTPKTASLTVTATAPASSEVINTPQLSCRAIGSCNDNASCGVRYVITYSGLTAGTTYTADLQNSGGQGGTAALTGFTQSGTTATATLAYTEANGSASYSGTLRLLQGGTVKATRPLNLSHDSAFSQIPACSTAAPAAQPGTLAVTFESTGTTAPYTFNLTNSSGTSVASGTLQPGP